MISITGVSLLVGGIGIMNVLLASVQERTREIGIRKAAGARHVDILRQFLAESVSITGAGAALGTLLGLGIAFLAEINRLRGGSEENFEPEFKALREMLPNVGAIGANLGAYATLWQQEQIDIAPYNFNFVQTLKGKGVPVDLSIPGTGPVGWYTSMHIVTNAAEPDLALQYIDTHLDPAVQSAMSKPPYDVIPTNSKVPLEGAITSSIAKSHADLAKVRTFDWEKLNPQRGALIERFNREIKL
jgi:putative spermidine/putrescine transport system substrate-binding protein